MVEALDNWVGAKIVPSRDHGDFIDGSLSHDSFRVGCMAAAALGQQEKSIGLGRARNWTPAGKAMIRHGGRMSFNAITEAFAKHLGGRCEPFGSNLPDPACRSARPSG
jgi:hypothetical protein